MATYLVLNCFFVIVVVLLAKLFGVLFFSRSMLVTIAVVVLFTALFDPLMVGIGLFSYAPEKILGITIKEAPIEDLLYAVLAGILVPSLWAAAGRIKKSQLYEPEN